MQSDKGAPVVKQGADQSARAQLCYTDGSKCRKKSGLGGVTTNSVPKTSVNNVTPSLDKRG